MSIPFSRPVGFSAIIRVAGKEWVTSDADKKGCAAEVVEIMQSALTVLQFPLAAIPSATSDAGPATQDFAISFAEDLSALEGDVSLADPTAIALDQPVVWVAPIISVPGGFPVRLEGLDVSDGTQGELASPEDTGALPEEVPLSTLASTVESVTASVAIENPSNAIDFPSDGSRAKTASARADGIPYAPGPDLSDLALQPGSHGTTEPQEMPAHRVFFAGQAGSRTQEQAALEPAPEPAIASDAWDARLSATSPGQVTLQAASVETVRTANEAQPRQSTSVAAVTGKRSVEALTDIQVGRGAVLPDMEPASDEIALTRLTDAKTALLQGSGASELPKLSGSEARDVSAAGGVATPVIELSAPAAPVPSSFWERFFTNRSDPQPTSVASPDQVVQTPVELGLTAVAVVPRLAAPKDDTIAGHFDEDDLVASDAEAVENVAVKAAAPSEGSGPSPALHVRPDPGPVLQVQPWSEGLPDRVDRLDSPLSVMSTASTPGVSTGSGGPLTLPVQQVAMQLAGVLVQASDRATELALAPEELGKVRLRLEPDAANPDRLVITINVERPETLDLFRRHAGELADAIRAAGYSGADIDFGAHGQGDNGKGQHSGPSAGPEQASDESPPTQHSPRTIAGATLDLRL